MYYTNNITRMVDLFTFPLTKDINTSIHSGLDPETSIVFVHTSQMKTILAAAAIDLGNLFLLFFLCDLDLDLDLDLWGPVSCPRSPTAMIHS